MPYLTEDTARELIHRVNDLAQHNNRKWGKMTITQMLAHCTAAIKMAFSPEAPEKRMKEPMAAFARWLFIDLLPFPKGGLPTADELDVNKKLIVTDDFDFEKNALIAQIENLTATGDGFHFQPHPVFGKMDRKKWGKLIYKHLNHHLKQFGA